VNALILYFSNALLVLILFLASALFLSKKKNYFDIFIDGAREGVKSSLSLIPAFCALVISVRMLEVSGVLGYVSDTLAAPLSCVGIPSELIPFAVTRPLSGSASMAMLDGLFDKYGVDSFVSTCASVIMGSSDTVVYVFSVYFSSVGVKKTRYAVPIALAVMLFMLFFCCAVCRLLYF